VASDLTCARHGRRHLRLSAAHCASLRRNPRELEIPDRTGLREADARTTLPCMTQPDTDEVRRPMSDQVARVLVDNHRAFLSFLERRVGRRDLAEDILQSAFTRSIERVETLRDDEAAVAWFYRALRNAIIDHHRRAGAAERALALLAAELDASALPEESVRDEVCRCVARLAGTLKPEYAAALQRVEVDGATMAAFAAEAGITKNNAAVRVFRAREALRKQVVASCGTCAEHGCVECSCGH